MTSTAKDYKASSILILCINYHSDEECVRFASELLVDKNLQMVHLLFVDNSETSTLEESLSTLKQIRGNFSVRYSERNLGYFGGAAWGLEQFLLQHEFPDWVIVCNADLHFPESDFIKRLVTYGNMHQHAVVAPAIISTLSGKDQNPFMASRPSKFRMRFYSVVFRFYPTLMLYSVLSLMKQKFLNLNGRRRTRRPCAADSQEEPKAIYAAHGACIAFRCQYFEGGGDLCYGAFLFGEEIFVAETVRRLGLTIGYDPRLRVIHSEHKTTGYLPSQKMASFMGQAAAYCAKKFFG